MPVVELNYLFVDSNNRFSYPLSNHFSMSVYEPEGDNKSKYLMDWLQNITMDDLLAPHQPFSGKSYRNYFMDFRKEINDLNNLCFSVFQFVQMIQPANTGLVHYGGMEDEKYYGQQNLSKQGLKDWLKSQVIEGKIVEDIFLPSAGDVILMQK